mgnify:CR=1 FL=1|tara:strand:+ start:182382 stop:183050 length:669 start_codon:yes stop_codon:yes gene_type:complete
MKLDNKQCLLAMLTVSLTVNMHAAEEKADIIKTGDECNVFLKFPIGGTPEQLISIFGEPTSKKDISISTYTWRVDDNFLTLQYDRGSLTSIEIDKKCEGVTNHKACNLFQKYQTDWPALNVVEAKLGKYIETGSIPREEWIYKGKTEKAYVELQNGGVEHIECIPVTYRYKFEDSQDSDNYEDVPDKRNGAVREEDSKPVLPSDESFSNPEFYDDSINYDNY